MDQGSKLVQKDKQNKTKKTLKLMEETDAR